MGKQQKVGGGVVKIEQGKAPVFMGFNQETEKELPKFGLKKAVGMVLELAADNLLDNSPTLHTDQIPLATQQRQAFEKVEKFMKRALKAKKQGKF